MEKKKNKKYIVIKNKNGYLIELCHDTDGYKDENKFIAFSLAGIIRVIKEDINKKYEKE